MDISKTPDDSRDWNSIDIFLFTNGQEYSPPRKYHFKAEEIRQWDDTLNFLARSQFGSFHSKIELYTLDGKKINTPLDLRNDAAYVAVKPADEFVQSGYEKYLLKASRSWEKRNERLNSTETPKSANTEINKEHINSHVSIPNNITTINTHKKIEDFHPLDTEVEYLTTIEKNAFIHSQKDAESYQPIQTTNNSLKTDKTELLYKKKPGSNARNTILKNRYLNSKSIDDGQNFGKKRTAPLPKSQNKTSNNSKRLIVCSNNKDIMKTNLENKIKIKEETLSHPNVRKTQINTDENITKTNENNDQLRNYLNTTNSPETAKKDSNVISNVYKNAESEAQSLFLDVDKKMAFLNNAQTNIPRASENIDGLGEKPKSYIKTDRAMSQQSTSNLSNIQASCTINPPGTFNINLNIDLKGYTIFKIDETNHANKCKTCASLMKPEKASQVNDDGNLNRETLKFEDDVFPQEESAESDIAKIGTEKVTDNNQSKVIVHCKCNLFSSENNTSSSYNFKENGHYLVVIPTERINEFMPSDNLESRPVSKKDIQDLLQTCICVPVQSNLETVSNQNPENVSKYKVSILQDTPIKLSLDNNMQYRSQGDIMQTTLANDLNMQNFKIDNSTQTDWCNILLQAKCHEDGRYTFHLPPLHLLAHYNLL